MQINPVYNELEYNCRKRLCKAQSVVESRLIPPHGVSITKVLSIIADAKCGVTEVFTGEARFSGRVNFRVLFVDGEGKNHFMESNADFSDKIECAAVTSETQPYLDATVLDTEVIAVSSGEIKLASVVEITLDADEKRRVNYLAPQSDGVYTRSCAVGYCTLIARGTGTGKAENTVQSDMTDILFTHHRAVITSKSATVDAVRIEGVIISEIVGEKEDGLLTFVKTETPFSEEFGAVDAKNGDTVVAMLKVSAEESREVDEKGVVLSVEYGLDFTYCVYACDSAETVTDAFSATNELTLEHAEVDFRRYRCAVLANERIEGSVTLKNDMPIVDSILASPAMSVTVTSARAEEGEVVIEGVISGNLIYYSAESNSKNSLAVEQPFSVKTPVSEACEGDEVSASGEILSVNLKIRRGNEIDIRAELAFDICVECESKCTVICGVTEGERREIPTSAISLHIVGAGESLWDASKALGATPEEIQMQNPQLEIPLKGGERVIYYRQIRKTE